MLNRFRKSLQMLIVNHTGLGKSIAETFVELVFGMIELGSVKHKKLAQTIQGNTVTSNIRTIERFFGDHYISSQTVGFMIYDLLNLRQYGPITLILDRTNWEYGCKCINIFVVTVVLGNTSIPIAFEILDKKGGATNFAERKAILEQVIALIGRENIKVVLGDREFVGDEWFNFLWQKKISFVIRIRNNFWVVFKEIRVKASALMATVTKNENREFKVKLGHLDVRLAGTRAEDGELVMVVAPRYFHGGLLKRYRIRWLIELYFRSIKSKGFNLEETHMTDPDKIKSLLAVIAIASALAVAAGRFRSQIKKIPIKKHGRPAFSIFAYGLDLLRAVLRNRVIASLSVSIDPTIFRPWSELVDLLFSFILGQKYVGY